MAQLLRTPLYDAHVSAGGRMVPFGGYELPVQYGGIIEEHQAVRTAVGLFDVSHMGQVFLQGRAVEALLHRCFTNNHAKSKVGELRYTFLLDERGRIKDDMIVYRLDAERFLTIPNAATTPMVVAWLQEHAPVGATVLDQSAAHFCLALQGPAAQRTLATLAPGTDWGAQEFFTLRYVDLGLTARVLVSRSGYTGEDGFELVGPAAEAPLLWQRLLQAGAAFGIKPCGLGARDTLRMEKGFLLSGQDFHDDRTPLEANTEFAVRYDHDFIGRAALEEQKRVGGYAHFCGLVLQEHRGVPRAHFPVLFEGTQVGVLSSGTLSPTLGKGIGLCYLPDPLDRPGTTVHVQVRDRAVPATVTAFPLVPKPAPPSTPAGTA